MKVLVLNSSPHKQSGATSEIVRPFVDGMRQAGAEVEEIYVADLDVKPCAGCFTCWVVTPGRCRFRDDMDAIYPKLEADILVLATPLYVDGMTGTMKVMLDRIIPVVEPSIEVRDDNCRHPSRLQTKDGKVVLVSVCGFHELSNFDPLVAHVKAICKNLDREYAGALLRPYASALTSISKAGLNCDDVLEAAREAGRQIVKDGQIDEHTLAVVSREIISRDVYLQALNQNFRSQIEAHKK